MQESFDYIRQVLNGGRYQLNVLTSAPTWVGNNGEFHIVDLSGGSKWLYIYVNDTWMRALFTAVGIGVFEEVSSVVRQDSANAGYDEDFVFGSPQLDDEGTVAYDKKMFFDKGKGAFRAGYVTGDKWDNANLGSYSFATGQNTQASGGYSHAEGYNTTASGNQSHAEGEGTTAGGSPYGVHAEGRNSVASGSASHAEGYDTDATTDSAHSEGSFSVASGYSSHTEGYATTASAYCAHAEGAQCIASLSSQHAHASGIFSTNGDAQYSRLVVRNQTTDATQTELFLRPAYSIRAILPANTTWVFHIFVNGRQTSADTAGIGNYGDSAGYEFKGVIRRRRTQAEATGDVAVYTAAAGDKLKIIINTSHTFDDIDMAGDASIDDAVASINAVTNFSTYAIAYKDGDGYLRVKSKWKTSSSRVQISDGTNGNGGECEDLFSGASVDVAGVDSTALVGSLDKTVLAEDDADWDATVEADDTNEALVVKVTGEVGKNINWVGVMNLVECGG